MRKPNWQVISKAMIRFDSEKCPYQTLELGNHLLGNLLHKLELKRTWPRRDAPQRARVLAIGGGVQGGDEVSTLEYKPGLAVECFTAWSNVCSAQINSFEIE